MILRKHIFSLSLTWPEPASLESMQHTGPHTPPGQNERCAKLGFLSCYCTKEASFHEIKIAYCCDPTNQRTQIYSIMKNVKLGGNAKGQKGKNLDI